MAKIIHEYFADDSMITWEDGNGETIQGTSNTLSSDEDLIFTGETWVFLFDPSSGNRDVIFSAPNIKMESLIFINNDIKNSITFENSNVNFDGASWRTDPLDQGKIIFSGDSKLNLTSESNKLLIICNDISGTITLDLDDSFVSGSTFSIQANAENNLIINNAEGYEVVPTTDGTITTYTVNRVSTAKEIKQITLGEKTYLLKDETARNGLKDKQDIISDLNTIREGAGLGATAVQPSALNNYATKSYVDYSLINGTPTVTGGNAEISLQDRAITTVTVDDTVSLLTFIFPQKTDGKARDFFVRLVVIGDSIPTLSFIEPNGDSVPFDVDDDSWAEIEQGVNILMFTDTGE